MPPTPTPIPPIPIIVGVGDVRNPSLDPSHPTSPFHLILHAITRALQDATAITTAHQPSSSARRCSPTTFLRSSIDAISVVPVWSWPYGDLEALLARELGVRPAAGVRASRHGGDGPVALVDEAAKKIAGGECRVVVVAGGEALGSVSACKAKGMMPPAGWTGAGAGAESASPLRLENLGAGVGATHSVGLPIHVYAMYENAFRARRGLSVERNHDESARLYAEFAQIAGRNEFAWNYGREAPTAEVISTVTERNRMICFPYPLLMNAFNNVNLAASCVLTSTEYARHLGIPESKWIYPLGGAGSQDSDHFWERPNFYSSPAISRSLDACLEVSGLVKESIDVFDFYSCFPIVPKLACQHLGIPQTESARPITLLGGLTFFGGAGNNYSMHAMTAMVRRLRKGDGESGLVLANGGVLTYQHALCLSKIPRRDGSAYPDVKPLPIDIAVPTVTAEAEGEAVIETYTVEFHRNGTPAKGFVVGRLTGSNHRFVANAGNANTLEQLASGNSEPVGRVGWVWKGDGGRNLFTFDPKANL